MSTTPIYARIDTDLKNEAEDVLSKLGITPTSAISMFYKQLVLRHGMPFDLNLDEHKPLDITFMSEDQIDKEIMKGVEDIEKGRTITLEELDEYFKNKYGL